MTKTMQFAGAAMAALLAASCGGSDNAEYSENDNGAANTQYSQNNDTMSDDTMSDDGAADSNRADNRYSDTASTTSAANRGYTDNATAADAMNAEGDSMAAMAEGETLTLTVAQSDEYGRYLADGEGRPLYIFTADTQGDVTREARMSCSGQCLDAWPAVTSDGEPATEGAVQLSLIDTMEKNGETYVTYDGWPLYYFASDAAPGEPKGQEIESFGGEWSLVTPQGMKVASTQ
ncbi:COG4315 family predicted lipoprotein [Hyphococcus sp.]|uniref:COG4315 family predicted lipoprotein n=1 Tax=Hyphococcus sp. TaxID=2038636 RepID=UPI003CCB7F75